MSGCSGGGQHIAYLGIHGIGDSVLNISQGRALRDRFVYNNECLPQTPREPAAGSLTHITTEYTHCRDGYPVVWAAFDGCACESGVRTWTKGEVWKFFSQFVGRPPSSSTAPSPSPTPSTPSTPRAGSPTPSTRGTAV